MVEPLTRPAASRARRTVAQTEGFSAAADRTIGGRTLPVLDANESLVGSYDEDLPGSDVLVFTDRRFFFVDHDGAWTPVEYAALEKVELAPDTKRPTGLTLSLRGDDLVALRIQRVARGRFQEAFAVRQFFAGMIWENKQRHARTEADASLREFTLDAAGWTKALDLYNALRGPLEMPDWHGTSTDALLDSMIWGGINGVKPPYRITVFNVAQASAVVRAGLEALAGAIVEHRAEFRRQNGTDIEVDFELCETAA